MPPSLDHERDLWRAGYRAVAGLDEVGRGSLAGPVVAGAVILPTDPVLCTLLRSAGLRDSKKLTAAHRERLVPLIHSLAVGAVTGQATAAEIDEHGIVGATRLAMQRALRALPCEADCLLLDAFPLPTDPRPQRAIVRGDDLSLSIAAASVIAKVSRDEQMVDCDATYPGYGFASNKGYATPVHLAGLRALGATPIHRMSWKPLRELHIRQLPLDEGGDGND